ncbi:hypothetical protein PVAND_001084 [Polypedilum vanderplanki]|uniref:Uncharacterized protein n=1 Tax=Polypedilum vanderplanki TaxID=319348 RepID=A0A9J6BM58_POLVA|nr:hypothetical protein PVAND_001084 [Polypedilum vanderplanki]
MFKPTFNQATKVWSGPKVPPIFNPDQNLGQLIVKVLEQTPDAETQISADTNVSVTCGEMRERILKFAVHLNNLGLKQGDVIGVVAGNTENIAPVVFACFLLGLPVNPLAPIMIESDIVQMYSKTKPKLIFCDEKNFKIVQNAVDMMKSESKIYTVMERVDGYECVTEILKNDINLEDFIYPEVNSDSITLILSSSGSTGSPKGILKSHKNMIIECHPISNYNPDGVNVLFQYSPIFWYSGLYFLIKGVLYKYKRIITTQSFSREDFLKIMHKYQVTHVFLPPYAIANLIQLQNLEPFLNVKCWMVGGSAVSKFLCEKFQPFIPNGVICIVYACSEQAILTTNQSMEKYGSSGVVTFNKCLKIIDENGNAQSNNQQGEICVKSISKFQGYMNEPEKTKEAFDGEWLKTGDIGYFDDDGYIYIIDRKKDMMKFQGYQVTPSEIETIINEIKGVVSSCVVGVFDSVNSNDIIHAFVIIEESSDLTENIVLNYVNSKVIDPKKIRGGVHFVKSFATGLTGKICRIQMRKQAAELININEKVDDHPRFMSSNINIICSHKSI